MAITLQVGDVGSYLDVTVNSQDGVPVNLAAATVKQFQFERPDGTMLNSNGSFVTDGTDGKVRYIFQSGDLNQPGTWKYQVYLVIGANENHTDIGKFKVLPNLPL